MKSTMPVPFYVPRRIDEEERIVRAMLARLEHAEDPYEGPGSKSPPTLRGSLVTSHRATLISAK